MEVYFGILIGLLVVWSIISGIISIAAAWKECIADGNASGFIGKVFSYISGNWIIIIGILLFCIPVWIILSLVVSSKKRQSCSPRVSQETNRYQSEYEEKETYRPGSKSTVRSSITLGRNRSSDILIDDCYEDVSRDHARIRMEGQTLILEDISMNGSYINGQKINQSQRVIQGGDEIRLGRNYVLSWNKIKRFFPDTNFSHETHRFNR